MGTIRCRARRPAVSRRAQNDGRHRQVQARASQEKLARGVASQLLLGRSRPPLDARPAAARPRAACRESVRFPRGLRDPRPVRMSADSRVGHRGGVVLRGKIRIGPILIFPFCTTRARAPDGLAERAGGGAGGAGRDSTGRSSAATCCPAAEGLKSGCGAARRRPIHSPARSERPRTHRPARQRRPRPRNRTASRGLRG